MECVALGTLLCSCDLFVTFAFCVAQELESQSPLRQLKFVARTGVRPDTYSTVRDADSPLTSVLVCRRKCPSYRHLICYCVSTAADMVVAEIVFVPAVRTRLGTNRYVRACAENGTWR